MKKANLFKDNSILLLDGAFGTQLQKRGLSVGAMPERLNVENPDLVYSISKEYIDAGSDIV
ncbi:MAG: homocysteine S-methyltransferase family protein, partial [Clostridia bacterium]|nr:homocysteine S-methyltransferase family protein [Clostridia bacterium]